MAKSSRLRFGVDYHVYHRSNDNGDLFIEEGDYAQFLALYGQHVAPVADMYAYCLLPNHVHLLVRILTQEEQRAGSPGRSRVLSPTRQFATLFHDYSEARGRAGTVFQPPFRRVGLSCLLERDFLAVYIHRNPMRHGLVNDFRQWLYSSYHAPDALCPGREELFPWFRRSGGFESAHYHQWPVPPEQIARLAPDDFD